METNEFIIRFCGTANSPKGLKNGKSYDLTIKNAEVRSINRTPNDDGTENEIATLKISEMSEVNIVDENEVLKCKKKRSQGQRLRFLLMEIADKEGFDREKFYEEQMDKIIKSYEN